MTTSSGTANSRLIIDSPSVKAYVGKISAPFRFADGITIGNVTTPWICFSMVSEDGTPLVSQNSDKTILISGVYDAMNTGFQFNYNVQGGSRGRSPRGWKHGA